MTQSQDPFETHSIVSVKRKLADGRELTAMAPRKLADEFMREPEPLNMVPSSVSSWLLTVTLSSGETVQCSIVKDGEPGQS